MRCGCVKPRVLRVSKQITGGLGEGCSGVGGDAAVVQAVAPDAIEEPAVAGSFVDERLGCEGVQEGGGQEVGAEFFEAGGGTLVFAFEGREGELGDGEAPAGDLLVEDIEVSLRDGRAAAEAGDEVSEGEDQADAGAVSLVHEGTFSGN